MNTQHQVIKLKWKQCCHTVHLTDLGEPGRQEYDEMQNAPPER